MSSINDSKKTLFVTGSGRGIGKAAALYFAGKAPDAWNIVINCAHNISQLQQTQSEIETLGASCLALSGDVGDYEQTRDIFEKIHQTFGSVDILVNNAGIAHLGLLTDMSHTQWNQVIQTNLTSVFNCCHQAIPDMVRQKSGKIINISSVWGNVGASCEVAYSAAKGGINAFTRALAKELAPSSIQVNAIACGVIDTAMNMCLTEDDRQALVEEIPACRMGQPDEVAELIYALATGQNYLTGQVITLDGGWI